MEELKKQAHKEFEEKKLITGAMWLVKMWEKNKNNTEIEIELPEHIKDDFKSFIDSLIDKTVQMTEERIVKSIKKYLLEKHIHFDKNDSSNNWQFNDEHPYVQSIELEDFVISLITNKSDINK